MPNQNPIRVLVVDDHAMIRIGMESILEVNPEMELVGKATNGTDAIAECERLQPDVVLMDMVMPGMNGVETIATISKDQPGIRFIVLTSFADDSYVKGAIEAGAIGYILKDSPPEKIYEAIRMAYRGDTVLAPEAMKALFSNDSVETVDYGLTTREIEVLRLIADGLNNVEIAEALTVSPLTIKTHVSNILSKMGAATRTQAVVIAFQQNLLQME